MTRIELRAALDAANARLAEADRDLPFDTSEECRAYRLGLATLVEDLLERADVYPGYVYQESEYADTGHPSGLKTIKPDYDSTRRVYG